MIFVMATHYYELVVWTSCLVVGCCMFLFRFSDSIIHGPVSTESTKGFGESTFGENVVALLLFLLFSLTEYFFISNYYYIILKCGHCSVMLLKFEAVRKFSVTSFLKSTKLHIV